LNEAYRSINKQAIDWADKIVIVADNVGNEGFPKEKIERWEIEDCDESEAVRMRKIIDKIEIRVKRMLEEIIIEISDN